MKTEESKKNTIIEEKWLLQREDTKSYHGTYRGDDYWTKDISEATHFSHDNTCSLDEQVMEFLIESESEHYMFVKVFSIRYAKGDEND